jgi:hypothetical protein
MDQPKEPDAVTSPLVALGVLSISQVETLGKRWINTVEALVGAAASDTGRKGVMALLEMTDEQMSVLLQKASEVLGPQRFQAIISGRPGGPTGALLTDQQKKDFGIGVTP